MKKRPPPKSEKTAPAKKIKKKIKKIGRLVEDNLAARRRIFGRLADAA